MSEESRCWEQNQHAQLLFVVKKERKRERKVFVLTAEKHETKESKKYF